MVPIADCKSVGSIRGTRIIGGGGGGCCCSQIFLQQSKGRSVTQPQGVLLKLKRGGACWLNEEDPLGARTILHQPRQQSHIKTVNKSGYEDEFRSSRSVAMGLHKRYKDVVNGGFTNNLKEFVSAGVTAYAVGCTDEGLRKELINSTSAGGGGGDEPRPPAVGLLKSTLSKEEVEECILWLSLVFLTILCSPPPAIVRWSTAPAVSTDVQLQWRGFCSLIANAYYVRGMAWIPVKTLQMEQMAVAGYAEEPSLVADRMRLVYATLEMICPQWPKH